MMAHYELFINDNLVLAGPGGGIGEPPQPVDGDVSLESFTRSYDDPARLDFVAHGSWTSWPYAPDSWGILKRDGVEVFRGLLDVPRPLATVRSYPGLAYTAHDQRRALDFPTAEGADGTGSIRLDAGSLSALVTAYIAEIVDPNAQYNVAATPELLGGAGALQCLPVHLETETIDGGFVKLASAAPGARLFIRPPVEPDGMSQYVFVNPFGSPTYDLVIEDHYVPELELRQSVDGCAGAAKTLAGQTQGSAEATQWTTRSLVSAWDPAYQQGRWTIKDAFTIDTSTGRPTPQAEVYRKFSFAAFAHELSSDMMMLALAEVVPDEVNAVWCRIEVPKMDIDWEAKTLMLALPAVRGLKVGRSGRVALNDPGRVRPATTNLQFGRTGTATIPIIINSVRFPVEGYAGRAYQLAPITCGFAKVIKVPGGVSIEEYTQQAHAAMSEPVVYGSIPLSGELPTDLWFLDRRINILSASHGETGYESLAAPMEGFRVDFGDGISSSIELHRDVTQMLREGA